MFTTEESWGSVCIINYEHGRRQYTMQPSARLWAAVEASLHAFKVLERCIVSRCPTRQASL